MTAQEFIRRLRKLARKKDAALTINTGRGKGDHVKVALGGRSTYLPGTRGELKTGLFRAICKDLNIDPTEL